MIGQPPIYQSFPEKKTRNTRLEPHRGNDPTKTIASNFSDFFASIFINKKKAGAITQTQKANKLMTLYRTVWHQNMVLGRLGSFGFRSSFRCELLVFWEGTLNPSTHFHSTLAPKFQNSLHFFGSQNFHLQKITWPFSMKRT